MVRFLLVLSLFCLFVPGIQAAGIRDALVNASKMETVHLRMGQSTVIRFKERPKKVVVGNQNYVNIEFIDNDVTIQPLGDVTTNLFVYGERGRVYGFRLRVGGGVHDDLVNVSWRHSKRYTLTEKKRETFRSRDLKHSLTIKDVVLVRIYKITRNLRIDGQYFIDAEVKNLSKLPLDTKRLAIKLTRGGNKLGNIEYAFENDRLEPAEATRLRILFRSEKKDAFRLHLSEGKLSDNVVISKRVL